MSDTKKHRKRRKANGWLSASKHYCPTCDVPVVGTFLQFGAEKKSGLQRACPQCGFVTAIELYDAGLAA